MTPCGEGRQVPASERLDWNDIKVPPRPEIKDSVKTLTFHTYEKSYGRYDVQEFGK